MLIAGIVDEDFVNYKKPCMTVMFPFCTFKCNKECGQDVCHNSALADAELISVEAHEIVDRYLDNKISEAIVMQGLEPFDSFDDLFDLVHEFASRSNDDIVIYTGYYYNEISEMVHTFSQVVTEGKLIIKYGRYVPDEDKHFDEVLGVYLASSNQYAEFLK